MTKKIKREEIKIPIEVSAKHVHLCKRDLEKLFGRGYELEPVRSLSQQGEFVAKETVDLIYGQKRMHNVGIVGPERKASQVEFSLTDAHKMSMDPLPKLKLSGKTFGSVKIKAEGSKGSTKLPCIVPKRHIHMSNNKAEELGIKDGQNFYVKVPGERGVIFDNVTVRTGKNYRIAMHLDTDEGNAAGINSGKTKGKLLLEYEEE